MGYICIERTHRVYILTPGVFGCPSPQSGANLSHSFLSSNIRFITSDIVTSGFLTRHTLPNCTVSASTFTTKTATTHLGNSRLPGNLCHKHTWLSSGLLTPWGQRQHSAVSVIIPYLLPQITGTTECRAADCYSKIPPQRYCYCSEYRYRSVQLVVLNPGINLRVRRAKTQTHSL